MSLRSRYLLITPVMLAWLFSGPALGADEDLQKGIALYQTKQFHEAVPLLHRYAQAKSNATATYYLALCYQNLRYEKEAIDLFERICSLWPASNEAKLSRQYLNQIEEKKKAQPEASERRAAHAQLLQPGTEAKCISREEWAKLPGKTRVPFLMEHGHMMVQAKINGKYAKLVWDTGASKCCISRHDFPDVVSTIDISKGKTIAVARPHGSAQMKQCEADIAVQDINRKVEVWITNEPGVSVIGENFFKEYNYETDNFYVRLTKMPYDDVVAMAEKDEKTLQKLKVGGGTSAGLASVAATDKHAPARKDKYSLPFERQGNIMLVEIEVNGRPVKAVFDTGCAPDGIVVHPGRAKEFGLRANSDGVHVETLTVGPITRKFVKAYPAGGMFYPLIGPKIFGDRPYVVDQKDQCIKFQY